MALSHASAGSTTPLPQTMGQSLSVSLLQPMGQQSSPLTHAVMGCGSQRTLHMEGSPSILSDWHWLGASHEEGQAPGPPAEIPGSHVSLGDSTTPLPQTNGQSLSRLWLPFAGQQPSPATKAVIGAYWQRALHVPPDS